MSTAEKTPVMHLTTAFGSRLSIRNPIVTDHAWGECVHGWAREEGRLYEEYVVTRLDTARDVIWEAA